MQAIPRGMFSIAPAGCRALGSCFELTARILADGMFKRHAVVVML